MEFDKEEARKDDWVLHDGVANRQVKPFAGMAETIGNKVLVFISPRQGNREKQFLGSDFTRIVMSPFDEEELLQIRSQVYSDQVNQATVLKRFERIGGIPRYIFEKPDDIPAIITRVNVLSCTKTQW